MHFPPAQQFFSQLFFTFSLFFVPSVVVGQLLGQQLQQSVSLLAADSQMSNAQFSLYVVDAQSGAVIIDKNGTTGLATASCLKLVTSAMAFETLGTGFRFKTIIGADGQLVNGVQEGDIYIAGGGDPSLGSWRWPYTQPDSVLQSIISILRANGIKSIKGNIYIEDHQGGFHHVTPGSWTWDDIGNYYGAAARQFNWHENQFDIFFATGVKPGDTVTIKKIEPLLPGVTFRSYIKTAAKGTGDQSVIYLPPFSSVGYIRGSLPAADPAFKVSGAIPDPAATFAALLQQKLNTAGIQLAGTIRSTLNNYHPVKKYAKQLGAITSPPLDSLNYWFMRKSINLYGEAFIKAPGLPKQQSLLEESEGVQQMQEFWRERGINVAALNIYDASGLSPQNRVTARALVTVLQYARTRPWFQQYYNGFPEYNGMKLKSGTIADVKGFAGYHTAKNGKQYIIAFLINNYNGPSSSIVQKMYKILDRLK